MMGKGLLLRPNVSVRVYKAIFEEDALTEETA
jgi:hypothetical protein